MAISPNGEVVACQSWLNGLSFGNVLHKSWSEIWNDKRCKKIRINCATQNKCGLKEDKIFEE
jgi:radical SAM protein with 4Fe4S-binding SPASM domain